MSRKIFAMKATEYATDKTTLKLTVFQAFVSTAEILLCRYDAEHTF